MRGVVKVVATLLLALVAGGLVPSAIAAQLAQCHTNATSSGPGL
jgi:hypothetical protein